MKYTKLQHNYSHHHHQGGAVSTNGGRSASLASSTSSKRMKKHNWGTRERTGMSFLIVIAFFAVFGVIILTEIFMIDDRGHSGMMVRGGGGGYGNRLGDSMPDYDNVKDDYDLIDASLLSDNKFGFVQFQDNKYKIQDADSNDGGGGGGGGGGGVNNGRLAGVLINSNSVSGGNSYAGGVASASAVGGNAPLIPWGKMLPNKVEESLPHYPFGITPTDGTWQIVNGTRFKFFVFSAYYDRRDGGKLIRVVGATKTRGPERVWCRLWYAPVNQNISSLGNNREQTYKSVTVIARVKVIRENWNLKYSACFVLCPVRSPDYDVPQHISIVSRLRAPPGNLLLLRNTDWDLDFQQKNPNNSSQTMMKFPRDDQIPDKLAVCVKPFHFDYDQALYLMEYLEFYALMGVSHFTFYNHTIGPQADCVLQHYIKGDVPDKSTSSDLAMETNQGIVPKDKDSPALTPSGSTPPVRVLKSYNYTKPTVQMLPWNLRMRSQKEIRTEGLFAALNDCLYRTMYRYKYLALVDLDEFIVPRHNDTLKELINSLNSRFRNRNTGAYSFQNAFFYLQFGDDPLVAQWEENEPMELAKLRAALVTQRKTRRRFKLHPQKQRSKYICKPEAVVEAGNHFVWEFLPGKGSLNVPPTDAILQHYRVCEFGGNDCIKAPSILDRTATKYVNRLMERVYKVYKHLKQKCKLPELPPLPKIMPPRTEMKPIVRQTEKKLSEQKKMNNNNNNENANNNVKKTIENPLKATTALQLNEMKMKLIQEKTEHELKTNKTTITNNTTITTTTQTTTTTIFMTSTTTTTTTTPPITTTMNSTKKENMRTVAANKRKRKVVVFFVDDQGQPRARLEYH